MRLVSLSRRRTTCHRQSRSRRTARVSPSGLFRVNHGAILSGPPKCARSLCLSMVSAGKAKTKRYQIALPFSRLSLTHSHTRTHTRARSLSLSLSPSLLPTLSLCPSLWATSRSSARYYFNPEEPARTEEKQR